MRYLPCIYYLVYLGLTSGEGNITQYIGMYPYYDNSNHRVKCSSSCLQPQDEGGHGLYLIIEYFTFFV